MNVFSLLYRVLAIFSFLGMLALLGIWTYRLVVFDPNDLPVIRAQAGPIRTVPADPGGTVIPHQDRMVTNMAAATQASPDAGGILYAPRAVAIPQDDLTPAPVEEDIPVFTSDAVTPAAPALEVTAPPLREAAAVVTADPVEEVIAEDLPEEVAALGDVPRPVMRPVRIGAAVIEADFVTASQIPSGASMVQVGSFDTQMTALMQWEELTRKEADLLRGMKRYIEEVDLPQGTHHRLRLVGFDNSQAAAAVCSSLKRRGTDCFVVLKP